MRVEELDRVLRPRDGWPVWVTDAQYRATSHPSAVALPPIEQGANCQRYAYAVLSLLERRVPPHRSSELWDDPTLVHVVRDDAADLDLALFNDSDDAFGAHVAVVFGEGLLHLCAEVGAPALWSWSDFAARPRYAHLVGIVRVLPPLDPSSVTI